jgi:hypothetical protein
LKQPAPGLRQRLKLIETRSKPVTLVHFHDYASIGRRPALRAELDDIIEGIQRGDGVAEAHDRAGIDPDEAQEWRDEWATSIEAFEAKGGLR